MDQRGGVGGGVGEEPYLYCDNHIFLEKLNLENKNKMLRQRITSSFVSLGL